MNKMAAKIHTFEVHLMTVRTKPKWISLREGSLPCLR